MHCLSCGARGPLSQNPAQAKALWQQINDNKFLLRSVIDESPNVTFLKDENGQFLIANKKLAKLYNTTPDDIVGKYDEDFNDNQEQVAFFKRNIKEIAYSDHTHFVEETSTDAETGQICYFQSSKTPIRGPNGERRVLVIANDVTKLHEARAESQYREKQFSDAMAIAGEGFWEWNMLTDTIHHNQKWCEMLGLDSTLMQHPIDKYIERIHPDDRDEVFAKLQAAIAEHKTFEAEYRMVKTTGMVIEILDRGRVVEHDSQGRPIKMVGSFVDISQRKDAQRKLEAARTELAKANSHLEELVEQRTVELRKANLELERLAHRDALTGLANRRAANERLNQEYERLKRNQVAYAVLLIDIDYFKRINDTFGHPIGDEALRHLTSILESNLREMDFVARFGGEEFIVLLPETSLEQAILVAEKLRLACANTPLNEKVSFTISIGVAIAKAEHSDEYEALNLADAELYKAKNLGRNCVVACSPAPVSSFNI